MNSIELMTHVLVIVTHVNSGSVVTMQEFSSRKTCTDVQDALTVHKDTSWMAPGHVVYSECHPK